jgi:Protein of unknown function (DUF1569)
MKSLASAEVLLEMRGRLLSVRADDRALWGKMDATQMVRHLNYSWEVALGERTVGPLKGMPPRVLKFLALRSGIRWGKNLQTTPELKEAIAEPCGVEFRALVDEAVERMAAVASGERWAPSHPMFGAMTAADWMRWGYLHTDHHLRQFGR